MRRSLARLLRSSVAAGALIGVAGILGMTGIEAGHAEIQPPAASLTDAHQAEVVQAVPAGPQGFAGLVRNVKPAVVNVSSIQTGKSDDDSDDGTDLGSGPGSGGAAPGKGPGAALPPGFPFKLFGDPHARQPPRVHALGSGFVIDGSGLIVTNYHVVENGTHIQVTLQDGTTFDAKEVGHDKLTDLALLKVEAGKPLPSVQFGDSDRIQVGDWVVSVGNPFGLGGSVTAGILSATGRDIHSGPYDDFLQIDAPINEGNSGGPTFDMTGRVIGINTAILSPNGGGSVGIGFAIPSNIATKVVDDLKGKGKVARGYLGVSIQPIEPAMEDALGVKTTNGALVAQVADDGPASRAGIKPGDVITGIDGKTIDRVRDLTWTVANTAAGSKLALQVVRDGQPQTANVTVAALVDKSAATLQVAKGAGGGDIGLKLTRLTPHLRDDLGIGAGVKGVVVADVAPGSPAADAGLKQGDIIEQTNHKHVASPADVTHLVSGAAANKARSVGLLINREGQDQFIAVELPDTADKG